MFCDNFNGQGFLDQLAPMREMYLTQSRKEREARERKEQCDSPSNCPCVESEDDYVDCLIEENRRMKKVEREQQKFERRQYLMNPHMYEERERETLRFQAEERNRLQRPNESRTDWRLRLMNPYELALIKSTYAAEQEAERVHRQQRGASMPSDRVLQPPPIGDWEHEEKDLLRHYERDADRRQVSRKTGYNLAVICVAVRNLFNDGRRVINNWRIQKCREFLRHQSVRYEDGHFGNMWSLAEDVERALSRCETNQRDEDPYYIVDLIERIGGDESMVASKYKNKIATVFRYDAWAF